MSESVSSMVEGKGGATGKGMDISLWMLQGLMALLFLMVGLSTLLGAEQMVAEFAKMGIGQ